MQGPRAAWVFLGLWQGKMNQAQRLCDTHLGAPHPARAHLGYHLIVEFWGGRVIEDQAEVERILLEAAEKAEAHPIRVSSHKFSPHGLTAVVLLAESHLSIHSWPEMAYLAIDLFTCGDSTRADEALEYLRGVFEPTRVEVQVLYRGKID
jgi:S-adenosylmethionine decarboxylase